MKKQSPGKIHLGENHLHWQEQDGTPRHSMGAGAHRSSKKDRRSQERSRSRQALKRGHWE